MATCIIYELCKYKYFQNGYQCNSIMVIEEKLPRFGSISKVDINQDLVHGLFHLILNYTPFHSFSCLISITCTQLHLNNIKLVFLVNKK